MTYGTSTRAVSSPVGTVGMYGPTSPSVKLVPLSVFFLNLQGDEEDGEEGLYGKRKPGKATKKKKGGRLPEPRQGGRAAPEPSGAGKGADTKAGSVKKQPPRAPERPSAGGPEPPKSESLIEGKINQPQKCKYCKSPATKAHIWADGRAYIPACDAHGDTAKRRIEKINRDKVSAIRPIPQGQSTATEQTPVVAPVLTPVKTGATRASSGGTGTGDIARYHVPVGPPLRRVTPIGDEEKKRRRRKLKGEDRSRWIERLSEIIK